MRKKHNILNLLIIVLLGILLNGCERDDIGLLHGVGDQRRVGIAASALGLVPLIALEVFIGGEVVVRWLGLS